MKRSAAVRRTLALVLVPFLSACDESEIPIEPEGEPRFTNLVIDKLDTEPDPGENLDAGDVVDYDLTATFQLANGWEDEDLDAYLFIESWSAGEYVRIEVSDLDTDVDTPTGTIRFNGTFAVPDCGAVDELTFFVGLWPADDDPDFYADSDQYSADVVGAGSDPCLL